MFRWLLRHGRARRAGLACTMEQHAALEQFVARAGAGGIGRTAECYPLSDEDVARRLAPHRANGGRAPWDDPRVRSTEERAILGFMALAEWDKRYRSAVFSWPVLGSRELLQRERRDGHDSPDPLLDFVRQERIAYPPAALTVERLPGRDTLLCWRPVLVQLRVDGLIGVGWDVRLRLTERGRTALAASLAQQADGAAVGEVGSGQDRHGGP